MQCMMNMRQLHVLYSVGLDCVDNGGTMERDRRRRLFMQGSGPAGNPRDLVWPRPASTAEAEHFHQQELDALAQEKDL